jgi:hypothetical protein
MNTVILNHDELKITKLTHKRGKGAEQIVHIKHGKTHTAFQSPGGKLVVFIGDNHFEIDESRITNEGQFTFAAFEINIAKKEQRSLITNKVHKIGFDLLTGKVSNSAQIQKDFSLKIFYPIP